MRPVIVVTGPTASGKSAFALEIARQFNGVVINADSMQVYKGLRILTARPTPEEEAQAPHKLYGWLEPDDVCSAGRWVQAALAEIKKCHVSGLTPIICGGTGFYIEALIKGLPPAPSIPPDIRAQARADVAKDYESHYSVLEQADPKSAARIHDPQRLSRALEIWRTTGKIPSEVLDTPPAPPKDLVFNVTAIMPERDQLYARINARTNIMANLGAVEEATAFLARDLNPELPAMRAIGVKEFASVKKNEILLQNAIEATSQATRRYAKRQNTWIRQRLKPDFVLKMEDNTKIDYNFIIKLYKKLLT